MSEPSKESTANKWQVIYARHVKRLQIALADLSSTVPAAKKDGKIASVFSRIPVPQNPAEAWEVWDRRMVALFGVTEVREDGSLLNFEVGPYGMDMVAKYLLGCAILPQGAQFQYEAAMPRLNLLIETAKKLKEYAVVK